MSKPVYLLVIVKGPTEAWFQLSKEEQDKLWAQVMEVEKRASMKEVLTCKSRWSNEEFQWWSVMEYPDMDAYLKKSEELEKLNWWRYVSNTSILGTKWEDIVQQ